MPADPIRRSRRHRERGTYQKLEIDPMKSLLKSLAASGVARSWITRQALKGAAALQTGAAVALAKAQVDVSGQTVDLIPAQTELAIVAAIGALIVGGAEVLMSYAVAHFGKAE